MKKDNAIILKTLIDTKPYVQDVVFDKFFAPYDLKGSKTADILTFEGRATLLNDLRTPLTNGKKVYIRQALIHNPFSGQFIETDLIPFSITLKNLMNDNPNKVGSSMGKDRENYLLGVSRHNNSMDLSDYSIVSIGLSGMDTVKGLTTDQVAFDFVLYHELAHAGYSQMVSKPFDITKTFDVECHKEKNSDLSAIVELIQLYDLNQEEAQKLADMIIKFRVNSSAERNINSYVSDRDEHYTEDAIFYLKKVIEQDFDRLKTIPDKEIGRYVDFAIAAGDKCPNFLFDHNKMDRDEVDVIFIKAFKIRNNRNPQENIEQGINDIATVYEKAYGNKSIYKEIIAAEAILADPVNGIKKIHESFDGKYIAALAAFDYEFYKLNKKDFAADIGPKIDSKTLQKKLNI